MTNNLLQPVRFYDTPFIVIRDLNIAEVRSSTTGEPLQVKSLEIRVWWNSKGYFARCHCGERTRYYAKASKTVHNALRVWASKHRCLSFDIGVPVDVPRIKT